MKEMATDVATTNMGEVDEIHKKEDETTEGVVINGNTSDNEMETQECETTNENEMESMEVDEEIESKDVIDGDDVDDVNGDEQDRNSIEIEHTDDKSSINDEEDDDDEDKEEEVQEIEDDEVVISIETKENGTEVKETIELNDDDEDSEREEGEVLIIDNNTPKENGTSTAVIDLQTPEKTEDDEKKLEKENQPTPRRSSRNLNRQQKRYSNVEIEEEEKKITITNTKKTETSEESDVEEVLPEDPLANIGDAIHIERIPSIKQKNKQLEQSSGGGGTIVVKDTKKLVEIASKTSSSNSIGKKEPTLVIIDTNSILSGRGPVPVNKNYQSSNLPIGLPAQGIYPANMRATITPIPMSGNSNSSLLKSSSSSSSSSNQPVLPTLTDDMFVVEAPSFIVPYVYEKPPVKNLKTFVKDYKKDVDKLSKKKNDDDTPTSTPAVVANDEDSNEKETNEDEKMYSYFGSPLGKFFIEIGLGLVQEFVQSDLLKQQKRKRDRERGKNPETLKTITSLTKNLEYTKENNEPYRLTWKKCEFCPFKSESSLAMSYHLETPHLKNYIYKCNFCTYETRSPHDILFHMEAEHCVRGRLERALSFHQCPNCPFEENQKGKLSRHMMACAKKFKPDRNLEPPLDWEPPAKIPRVPKMRPGLNTTSSAAYQAMSKATLQQQQQIQLLTKMQLQSNALLAKSGGGGGKGGRATTLQSLKGAAQMIRSGNLPGMVYKQAMSGGSVLVPTNYQLSGNQVFTSSSSKSKPTNTPSISITPLPRASTSTSSSSSVNSSNQHQQQQAKPGDTNSKNSFVICEICDGYIKDLEQLRNHMQWIHKVKIHPKMIYNRPPLNCQKCQFRFFTDQGLERHLLGSHGLVTSSMQDAANRSKDAGRCPICGRVYQWKLLNHVARDHNMTLKPAHLSYKCTVCTATFGMYKQFENHVYSAHSVVAKRVMDKKTSNNKTNNEQTLKPLKINDEITIIPQPAKNSTSKEDKSSASSSKNNEKKLNINNRSDRLTRRSSQMDK